MVPERGVPCYSAKRLAFGSFRIFVLRPGIEPMPDFQGIPFFLFLTVKKLSEKLREKYREQPYTLRSDSFAHFATFAFCLRHTHIFFFSFLNHLAGSYLKYFNMYLLRKLTCLTQPQ